MGYNAGTKPNKAQGVETTQLRGWLDGLPTCEPDPDYTGVGMPKLLHRYLRHPIAGVAFFLLQMTKGDSVKILIFANGDLEQPPDWLEPYFAGTPVIIAADGGANHLSRLGRLPDWIIGDFDSLEVAIPPQVPRISYPTAKDETDLELALLYAVKQSPQAELFVFAGTGGRLDQTLANLLLLAHPTLRHKAIRFVQPHQQLWLITHQTTIVGQVGDKLSLIPIGGDVQVAGTTGLAWPLQNETIYFGTARGISNQLIAQTATVQIHQGWLLCIHTQRDWGR